MKEKGVSSLLQQIDYNKELVNNILMMVEIQEV